VESVYRAVRIDSSYKADYVSSLKVDVFCIYLRTNNDFCPILLVFVTKMKSVYCAVWTGSLNEVVCASSLKG
jgi:hypothetical protein